MTGTKITRTERLRRMKQEADRLQALQDPAPALADDLEAILGSYSPRKVDPERWNGGMGEFILDLVRRGQCSGKATVRQLLSEASLYVDWALDQGVPMTIGDLMDHAVIDRWVATNSAGKSDITWGNRHSRIRNLARHVNPGPSAPPRPEPFTRKAVQAPYSRAEVAAIERLAIAQPTRRLRRQLCAMVGLGLGAGLSSRDLRHLRRSHVHLCPSGRLVVHVPGDNARTVPVLPRYVTFLEAGLQGLKDDDLVLGQQPERRKITAGIVATAAIDHSAITLRQARLRATWLLELITTPVALADLMSMAGLTGGSSLVDLLPYASDPQYVEQADGDRSC